MSDESGRKRDSTTRGRGPFGGSLPRRPLGGLALLAVLLLMPGPGVAPGFAVDDAPAELPGALDLDVRPEAAEVWIDGERIGVADQFDGFPRYLWLSPGEYRVVFYRTGYRTVAREFTVYPGAVVRVTTRLERGESVPPQELMARSTSRAEARIAADRARAAAVTRDDAGTEPTTSPPTSWQEPWREASSADELSARLRLRIEPEDAAVYLDGRFLGSARELHTLHAGLRVEPGAHRLEVVHPDFETEVRELELEAQEERSLDLSLRPR